MKKIFSLLLVAMVMLTACTKQDVEIYDHQVLNTVTIYLNKQEITRAVPTTDPKSVENTVNTVTVGVFKSDGTVRTIKDFTSPGKSITLRVANLTTTDKVVCVANTNVGAFSSVKTLDEFNSKEISLDNSLTANTVDIIPNNLLMYGTGSILGSGDSYTSSVDMYHLNSKVSLNSLATSIPNNGTFKAKEIYLINVPASFKCCYDNPYLSSAYLHGSLNAPISGETQKLYLGSGNINGTVNKLFYYSAPNNSTKYTRIVIFGSYDSDGYGPNQAKDTYYPIIINKNVLPNKNYILNVTIKGPGVDTPTDDLNYSNLTVTLNVNNFDDVSKDITLD